MDAAGYATLNRQSGLMREMGVVANNIANSSTTGFRREGVVFSEFVAALDQDPSLSMAHASGRHVDLSQSTLSQTGRRTKKPRWCVHILVGLCPNRDADYFRKPLEGLPPESFRGL